MSFIDLVSLVNLPDLSGWIPSYDPIGWHIVHNNAPCAYYGAATDMNAFQYNRSLADPNVIVYSHGPDRGLIYGRLVGSFLRVQRVAIIVRDAYIG